MGFFPCCLESRTCPGPGPGLRSLVPVPVPVPVSGPAETELHKLQIHSTASVPSAARSTAADWLDQQKERGWGTRGATLKKKKSYE